MTRAEFQELLAKWCQDENFNSLRLLELKQDIEFLENVLYNDYQPTNHGAHADFGSRIATWIGNLDNETDQQTLLTILRYLMFISRDNFEAAHRTAYSDNVVKWLLNINRIDIFNPNAAITLNACVASTLFTQITDSFRLNEFLRVNNISGQSSRYNWHDHPNNWDRDAFCRDRLNSASDRPFRYLVLFEDFIGSGTQMKEIIDRAVTIENIQILLCPLCICPKGANTAREYARKYPRFTYSPVLELDDKYLISRVSKPGEPIEFGRIRDLAIKIHNKIRNGNQEFGPFGFQDTGALIVKHDNCPDNTLPVIHKSNPPDWFPIFLRVSRE